MQSSFGDQWNVRVLHNVEIIDGSGSIFSHAAQGNPIQSNHSQRQRVADWAREKFWFSTLADNNWVMKMIFLMDEKRCRKL